MSPLYATPPISPGSDIEGNFEDHFGQPSAIFTTQNVESNDHFARDTHMRIILGNSKETNQPTKYVSTVSIVHSSFIHTHISATVFFPQSSIY